MEFGIFRKTRSLLKKDVAHFSATLARIYKTMRSLRRW